MLYLQVLLLQVQLLSLAPMLAFQRYPRQSNQMMRLLQ
jgi:hypothetical protein